MKITKNLLILIISIILLTISHSSADDWPQFRGINRDGKSTETGLLKKWPANGPELIWTVQELGKGYSSAAIANGLIYITGLFEEETFLSAFSLDGKLKWKVSCGPGWDKSYPGTRSTPTINSGRVYFLSGTGNMLCFDAKTGKKIWQVDIMKKFKAKNKRWGISESILVDGDKIYCTPGGEKGVMVSLDAKTGKTIWASKGFGETSAYSSPVLVQRGSIRLLITIIQKSVIGINAETGELIWKVPHPAAFDTASITPVYQDGDFFVSSVIKKEFTNGGLMFSISADGKKVKQKWNNPALDNHHGGLVLVDNHLYGSGFDDNCCGDWFCVDWETGKTLYEHTWDENKGSIIYADGMLYCYQENDGTLALVKVTPEKFDIISSFTITQGKKKHWAHPSIADGKLYIRHGEFLMAYNIKKD